ncbi:MAG: poly-beta-1,6-N-acetyl-D-glucosamine synthase [Candidatus Omnitrophota bacterium]
MKALWTFLNYFVFLYPAYMSFVWSLGGLLFFFRRERTPLPELKEYPFFSIIIPAHNEAQTIAQTISYLEHLDYPGYEVIVVNDGSRDQTPQVLDKLLERYPGWLKVVHLSPNSGKANALNAGILVARAEFFLVIDADCFLTPGALKHFAWHFANSPRVGAVTGNPRILNRTTLLGKIQVGEYSSIIGLIKRAQRILGKVLTVSGVLAAFRRSAVVECGFFDADTVTEDIDMTWKLQKRFWEVRYEPRAVAWILSPETVIGLWKQRVRWSQGGVEVIKKHCDVWADWRQRRFWPIYFEYVAAVVWAFALGFLFVSWMVMYVFYLFGQLATPPHQPFIPPAWTGGILALVCLFQFMISLFIDARYEGKSLLRYYFWIIWYPLFYWIISGLTVFVGMFNVFILKGDVSSKWESPDRGIQTLK